MNFEIVIYLCLILSVEVFCKKSKIMGGEDALIEEFPSVVSLKLVSDNTHGCGGAIISKRHIITAAHCVTGHSDPINEIRVHAGTSLLSGEGGTIYNILRIDPHPQFSGYMGLKMYLRHDIAIVTLKEPIIFDEVKRKLNLPIFDIHQGDKVNLTGWGTTTYPTLVSSSQLQKAEMTLITSTQCGKILKYPIHRDQICAYQRLGVGACVGDSGNPLIKHGKVIGIASFVIPCGVGVPDVYTNVYSYLNFIRATMRNVNY